MRLARSWLHHYVIQCFSRQRALWYKARCLRFIISFSVFGFCITRYKSVQYIFTWMFILLLYYIWQMHPNDAHFLKCVFLLPPISRHTDIYIVLSYIEFIQCIVFKILPTNQELSVEFQRYFDNIIWMHREFDFVKVNFKF